MAYKRLTGDQRIKIQACINLKYTLQQTSDFVRVDRSTIYREITRNCYYPESILSDITYLRRKQYCPTWKKFPYTCNNCKKKPFCLIRKRYYDCSKAEEKFNETKHTKNLHYKASEDDLKMINSLISPLIKENGQSLRHIYVSNPILQTICCERTLRRYVYKGLFDAKCYDLPRYVRFFHKSPKTYPNVYNPERLLNRTFSDYLEYINKNKDCLIWQYDSVVGNIKCKKAILTITFPKFRFQFGILIDKGCYESVLDAIGSLKQKFGRRYSKIFQVNLSDNGTEFSKFYKIEESVYNSGKTHVFYCNPYKSNDKAACERNHQFIRYVIPKGQNFDDITQDKINLMFSHINSYVRESNQNKTPYQLCIESFGTKFTQMLGIEAISPNNVCLKPSLIK